MDLSSRQRFLAACACHPVDRPPIWIMRQAGRYLPEYRQLKQHYSFVELVRTPELATEVTLQPLQRFALDAAILFSDILVIPEALGQPYHFREGEGVIMDFALDSAQAIDRLQPEAVAERLAYVPETLRRVRRTIGEDKALLGFGGSPWTLAAYMIEGRGSSDFTRIKTLYYKEPAVLERLLAVLTQALIDYFRMQIQAGVDAIQIFDSWASLCPGHAYENLSLNWIQQIITALPQDFPVILFARGMAGHHTALVRTGAWVLSLDAGVRLDALRQQLPSSVALQGNLDPIILNTEPAVVAAETQRLLRAMQPHPGHIVNLGHGILPQAKVENVQTMVETVRAFGTAGDSSNHDSG